MIKTTCGKILNEKKKAIDTLTAEKEYGVIISGASNFNCKYYITEKTKCVVDSTDSIRYIPKNVEIKE